MAAPGPGSASGSHLVAEGDNVVLDERGEKQSFIKVKAKGVVRVGKKSFPIAPLIGAPYGAMFKANPEGTALERMDSPIHEWDFVTRVEDTERDNSSLIDANDSNQKLSQEAVEALKQSGKTGAEIVDELCSNSATFSTKTEFSQDKYKKKKAKKYIFWVTVRQPTARAICQAYYNKGPDRVFNLRYDSLAIILNMANVAPATNVLLFDACMGVVAGGVLERLGGHGSLCFCHMDRPYGSDALRAMNLSPAEAGAMCSASLAVLRQAKDSAAAPGSTSSVEKQEAGGATAGSAPPGALNESDRHTSGTVGAEVAAAVSAAQAATPAAADGASQPPAATATGAGPAGTGPLQRKPNKQLSLPRDAALLSRLVHPGFSTAIIAAPKIHTGSLMQQVLPLLRPSATFVVYSPWVQPLAECLHQLQSSKQAVMLQLGESWMRPHQVLPMRTHPHMMCSGTGGYILTGIALAAPPGSTDAKTVPVASAQADAKPATPSTAAAGSSAEAPAVVDTPADDGGRGTKRARDDSK